MQVNVLQMKRAIYCTVRSRKKRLLVAAMLTSVNNCCWQSRRAPARPPPSCCCLQPLLQNDVVEMFANKSCRAMKSDFEYCRKTSFFSEFSRQCRHAVRAKWATLETTWCHIFGRCCARKLLSKIGSIFDRVIT